MTDTIDITPKPDVNATVLPLWLRRGLAAPEGTKIADHCLGHDVIHVRKICCSKGGLRCEVAQEDGGWIVHRIDTADIYHIGREAQ